MDNPVFQQYQMQICILIACVLLFGLFFCAITAFEDRNVAWGLCISAVMTVVCMMLLPCCHKYLPRNCPRFDTEPLVDCSSAEECCERVRSRLLECWPPRARRTLSHQSGRRDGSWKPDDGERAELRMNRFVKKEFKPKPLEDGPSTSKGARNLGGSRAASSSARRSTYYQQVDTRRPLRGETDQRFASDTSSELMGSEEAAESIRTISPMESSDIEFRSPIPDALEEESDSGDSCAKTPTPELDPELPQPKKHMDSKMDCDSDQEAVARGSTDPRRNAQASPMPNESHQQVDTRPSSRSGTEQRFASDTSSEPMRTEDAAESRLTISSMGISETDPQSPISDALERETDPGASGPLPPGLAFNPVVPHPFRHMDSLVDIRENRQLETDAEKNPLEKRK